LFAAARKPAARRGASQQEQIKHIQNMKQEELLKELEKAKEYLVIVEGKKDFQALKNLGFNSIFIINETGRSLGEKIEQVEKLAGKTKICILTDFDKKGKKLYLLLKSELSMRNVRLDNSLRGMLLKNRVQHIEDIKIDN